MRVRVDVRLKAAVLDPQGAAVSEGLRRLGFEEVTSARVGKVIELELGEGVGDAASAQRRVAEMCDKLLANPVIEDFTVTLADAPEV